NENGRIIAQIIALDSYYEASFTVYNVTMVDFGDYQCCLSLNDLPAVKGNIVQLRVQEYFALSVQAPPSIVRKDIVQNHKLLMPTRLDCVFLSFPKYTSIVWRLPDGNLSSHFQVIPIDSNKFIWMTSILIDKLTTNHAGIYSCEITNGLGLDTFDFTISVSTFAHIEDAPDQIIILRTGEKRNIECSGVNLPLTLQKVTFFITFNRWKVTYSC
ncbi:hypothetical protein Btru_038631, partial [Bulinus truncatus]